MAFASDLRATPARAFPHPERQHIRGPFYPAILAFTAHLSIPDQAHGTQSPRRPSSSFSVAEIIQGAAPARAPRAGDFQLRRRRAPPSRPCGCVDSVSSQSNYLLARFFRIPRRNHGLPIPPRVRMGAVKSLVRPDDLLHQVVPHTSFSPNCTTLIPGMRPQISMASTSPDFFPVGKSSASRRP